jgi:hypothetical protein
MVWQQPVESFSMKIHFQEPSFCFGIGIERQSKLFSMMDKGFGYVQNAFLRENFIGGLKVGLRVLWYFKLTSSRHFSGMATRLEAVFQRHGKKFEKRMTKKDCFCIM